MEDYPRSLMDLETRFATEEARREYLGKLFYRLLERAVAVKPVLTRRWSEALAVGQGAANTTGSRYLSEGNTPLEGSPPGEGVICEPQA
jgi:hypothetical protein